MRKWTMGIGTALLAISLAACGTTAEPTEEVDDKAEVSEMTLEEVFAKSTEASESVESLHADMITNQKIDMGAEGMQMDMDMETSMDMTIEPMAFYQQAVTTINSEDIQNDNPTNEMEMYFTAEEGLFLYEPTMGQWMQIPAEGMEELTSLADQQTANPAEQLEQLKEFQDDFTFEQTADEYILTLDASGEEFEKLLQSQVEKTFSEMQVDMKTLMEAMQVNSISYELFIDKETFFTNKMNMVMDMDMDMEDETMNIKSDMKAEYSKYNEIDAIVVPDEVKASAQSIDMP
ncbi:DUF6612 family protein [Planomicrobium sp. YIM 101495]|uniref:DUF6612 family protein n=1 Tax=Planomicrobium sp. YIM 101495 TaxID=2665160 RepID=UPI0012B6D679|nr:DUF6612 family protein [Planomicrobium sp. YIM 101495]MTD31517.1 hypothetical protein [Planomicrobium sp. YIM 101495]